MKDLRKLNFYKLISIGAPDVTAYSYDEYRNNGHEHKPINGYCVSCEEKGYSNASDDDSYKLTNMSHGAHSCDFFRALKEKQDTTDWYKEPIMFVYESPSLDYKIYREVRYNGYNKHPSKDWYWIHSDWESSIKSIKYPNGFKGGVYGDFVWSAILTFKLANVYVTNLVKCGLNNAEGKFKGIASFKDETIDNCYKNFLKEEISIFKPKIIFAVGSAVERWVNHLVKVDYEEDCLVQQLPHPAGQRRGFRDDHYRAIYFWSVVRALHEADIINTADGCKLAETYLENYG